MRRAKTQLTPTERRERVALLVTAGKSNRAIAARLGVDESTIRRDRRFLEKAAKERSVKPAKRLRVQLPPRPLRPDPLRKQRMDQLVEVAQSWFEKRTGVLSDVEYILDKAGKLLYAYRHKLPATATYPGTPSELLALARPKPIEDDVTGLESQSVWFARWLALCLPRDEESQDEVLRGVSIWARSTWGRFVY